MCWVSHEAGTRRCRGGSLSPEAVQKQKYLKFATFPTALAQKNVRIFRAICNDFLRNLQKLLRSCTLVGKLLGHRRHRTTAGYAHLADDHLVEVAEKVGAIIVDMFDAGSTV